MRTGVDHLISFEKRNLKRVAVIGMLVSMMAQAQASDLTLPMAYVIPIGAHWFVTQSSTESVGQLLGSDELIAGPFASEEACNDAKPKDTDARKFKCVTSDAPDFALRTPLQLPIPAH